MKKYLFLSVILIFSNCKSTTVKVSKPTEFYLGTYTNGESEGIYTYQISEDGFFANKGLVAKTNNPSFLAKSFDNKTLLTVDETDVEGTGFVKSYQITKDSLQYVSTSKSGGAHPCFITVNQNNQILVANYSGGSIGYLEIDNQSGLTNLLDIQQHVGKGTTDRQEAPHAHSVWFHPNKKELIAADLGTNELWFSKIDESEKTFSFTSQKTLQLDEGSGPRHLVFHSNTKWFYVLNELNNTISLIKEKNNVYFIDATTAMLPKNFDGFSKGADIHITNDGKFLYASNRGHHSIVIYKINKENGLLTLVGFEDVRGKNPRNFAITPNQKYIVVANQDSNTLVSFSRNTNTGKLTFIDEIFAPTPVCVLF